MVATSETFLPLSAVLKENPHTRELGPRVAARWCNRGCRGRDGVRHVLEHRLVGGRFFVSAQGLARFLDALNELPTGADDSAPSSGVLRSPTQRRSASAAAAAELDALGL